MLDVVGGSHAMISLLGVTARGLCTTMRISLADVGRIAILRGLSPEIHVDFASRAIPLTARAGRRILLHLDESEDVYFILSGRVRTNLIADSGRQVTYQLLGAGEMFGELSAIDGLPRSASVYAEETSRLAKLTGAQFRSLVRRHPELALRSMERIASLARWLAQKLFEVHTYNVRGRIYIELLRLHEGDDSGTLSGVAVADRDMASRVGTTRENVNRIYAELRKEGLIERRAGAIWLKDPARLRQLLEGTTFG